MNLQTLTPLQLEAATASGTSFLYGPAGTGKTTALHERLLRLLRGGEPAYTILALVAEPEHRDAFLEAVRASGLGPFAELNVTNYTQLARRMVSLFWPLVARDAGFARPYQPPAFLSYDLAQVLMWRVVTPLLGQGAFANLRLRPQQIVSQLLDTLNRAALNALSLEEAISRQSRTWSGEAERRLHLDDAATAARAFRRQCLENSLLDLSLMVEVFDTQLVRHPEFHRYFRERYRHLLVDNLEEQTPAGQNFVTGLMSETQTTAVAADAAAGYKRFLSADPHGAEGLRTRFDHVYEFTEGFVAPADMALLGNQVENFLGHTQLPTAGAEARILDVIGGRYRREMVNNLAPALHHLVYDQGVAPRDIAIIVPYMDGALRYMLTQALREAGLPYRLLRRRTSPREEPRVRAWLTWLALAHPDWGIHPAPYDVAEALTLSIDGLDPARAQLLVDHLYRPDGPDLAPTETLPPRIVERAGEPSVRLVEELRVWLAGRGYGESVDTFLHSLFNELLSQPHFRPEPDLAGAAVLDWLVRAAARLRKAAPAIGLTSEAEIGATFIDAVNQGLVTANPPDWGEPPDPNGVVLSTIYAYLLAGEPARVQVWLETAAQGWWDIPRQPLSNAFVLVQSRPPEELWTMDEDFAVRNELLTRIIRGLTARCRDGVILASSDLDRRGVRQDGPLWRALGPLIRAKQRTLLNADAGAD
ncbi:UvrD-helicase domain-containing protein [Promineifilum sp.]|uniref:UvrD-helicase domain-containing protein n=1 Tax=Promineifilum sp. TaxID=2664178 RepID=UPI0035ADC19E